MLQAIDVFAAGKSVLIISHSPAAVELADSVIAMPRPARVNLLARQPSARAASDGTGGT